MPVENEEHHRSDHEEFRKAVSYGLQNVNPNSPRYLAFRYFTESLANGGEDLKKLKQYSGVRGFKDELDKWRDLMALLYEYAPTDLNTKLRFLNNMTMAKKGEVIGLNKNPKKNPEKILYVNVRPNPDLL